VGVSEEHQPDDDPLSINVGSVDADAPLLLSPLLGVVIYIHYDTAASPIPPSPVSDRHLLSDVRLLCSMDRTATHQELTSPSGLHIRCGAEHIEDLHIGE